jgi:hypothetical protein
MHGVLLLKVRIESKINPQFTVAPLILTVFGT